jgi:hypothetical protein
LTDKIVALQCWPTPSKTKRADLCGGPVVDPRKLHPPKGPRKHTKYRAFTRYAELNLYGMVDTQIAMLEEQ